MIIIPTTPQTHPSTSGASIASTSIAPAAFAERACVAGLAIGALLLGSVIASGLASPLAVAGTVSQAGSTTILSAEVSNEDIVLVLDARTEEILAYRTDLQRGIELLQRLSLPQVFSDARVRGIGSK